MMMCFTINNGFRTCLFNLEGLGTKVMMNYVGLKAIHEEGGVHAVSRLISLQVKKSGGDGGGEGSSTYLHLKKLK